MVPKGVNFAFFSVFLLTCCMQVTVCAVDPGSDQLTSIQLPSDASLTDAAQMLGNALSEDDSVVQQYWVNLDPDSQDDVIPRLPHGDPIFEINLFLLSARPGGKRCVSLSGLVIQLSTMFVMTGSCCLCAPGLQMLAFAGLPLLIAHVHCKHRCLLTRLPIPHCPQACK